MNLIFTSSQAFAVVIVCIVLLARPYAATIAIVIVGNTLS